MNLSQKNMKGSFQEMDMYTLRGFFMSDLWIRAKYWKL
jgi:hypothetical protein